ncbi:nucleotidyltransferase family protein [Thalassomonas sp. M1454]|uniref:nucleotidyltransferase family protein n=1 Tax=Thalassomonas sp. M1454 TaxID=2594477 RepID=UPI00117FB84D|nr:nucleotidyltransferase family protein [Thalassomonas sp. M1454]TRX57204.1 nucleotidyltransferase family protein [Thalassomonas sp. M1454]
MSESQQTELQNQQVETVELPEIKIYKQTFYDLGMWLTRPNTHTKAQLSRLLDEDMRLPLLTLANKYWLVGALTHSLKHSKIWNELDNELQAYLLELETFYFERAQSIIDEAIYACTLLNSANIKVVMLKGGANLFSGVAQPISSRFMTDIDLLIPEEQHEAANDVLKAAGYNTDQDKHAVHAKEHHHAPALYREGGACCVELHRWVLKKSVSDVLATEEVWQQAIELELTEGLSVQQLCPNHQAVLSIAHSEISHSGYEDKHFDLRQLINLDRIANFYLVKIDWRVVEQHFIRCNKQAPLYALLYAMLRITGFDTTLQVASNKQAQQHFIDSLAQFEQRQGTKTRFSHLLAVLKGYNSESIKVAYGSDGSFPVTVGRLKHLKRHLLMALSPTYLKRFLNKF